MATGRTSSKAQSGKRPKAKPNQIKPAKDWLNIVVEAAFAILVGLLAFASIQFVEGFTTVGDLDQEVQDRIEKLYANIRPSPIAPPVVVVDLSQDNAFQLGYPAVFPRDTLANLLKVTAAGGPRLIVVDVDVSWGGDAAQEKKLEDQLEALSKRGEPAVLLMRHPLYRHEATSAKRDHTEPDLVKATRYDSIVDASPNLFWVSALASVSGDGVLRRYRTAPLVCRAGRTERLPSVQLAGCLALSRQSVPAVLTLAELRRQFDAKVSCKNNDGPGTDLPPRLDESLNCNGHEWQIRDDAAHHPATADIGYNMTWTDPTKSSRPQVPLSGAMTEEFRKIDIFAPSLSMSESSVENAKRDFGGKVVIIGSSAQEFGDLHRTPLNTMPGVMVLANAIKSGLDAGPARHISFALSISLTVIFSVISYLVWLLTHDVIPHHVRPVIKLVFDPLLAGLWFLIIAFLVPDARILHFLLPQSVVLTALTGLRAVRKRSIETTA